MKSFKEGIKAKSLQESTLSVKINEIETQKPKEKPRITCSDGTPTGKLSSGVEQDGQPE